MISMKKFYHYLVSFLLLFMVTSCFTDVEDLKIENKHIKTVLQLATSEKNPRNSEGDFISLKSGRIKFIYSHFTESNPVSDSSPAHLASRYSDDGGKTWSENDVIEVENESKLNIMSVSLLRLHNDNIALFYLRKNSPIDCIPMLRISKDEGETWEEPYPCIVDKKGYFVLNNGRAIQLKNGRILIPVSLHRTPESNWSDVGKIYCYYSDDNGITWESSSIVPNKDGIIIQEPGVIEMKNGGILMYMRATGGYQQLSYSHDKGQTWSDIESSNIASPLSPATLKTNPITNDWLLVWNNTKGENKGYYDKRTPLTAALSKDEGVSWRNIKNIADNPYGFYCYTGIHFVDNENVLISVLTNELKTDIILIEKDFFKD